MKTFIALGVGCLLGAGPASAGVETPLTRTARSGSWSDPATWDGGKVPGAGARVQVRTGHAVVYDVESPAVVRSLHIAGVLSFATDRDTRLDVGLIKIQAGDDATENGFDCDAHLPETAADGRPRAALEVGTADRPLPAGRRALVRLAYVDGMDRETCPALVCCGGRMDLHGAELSRTWIKLGAPARAGDAKVMLSAPVTGWRAGDRVILTATVRQNKRKKTFRPSVRDDSQTEERTILEAAGAWLTLDRPLRFDHACDGEYRGDVANLSRNVVVESADPDAVRGHTMYHRGSAGSISYAEFRHLGKPGLLGKYSLHFHRLGDSMRGTSVVGASIWDSGNRWITIHGTNYLVVRDCVGYRSLGHGFFLEDGTEVDNVLDRNLAVQAYNTKPLPDQVLPFDKNDGSGFWWANSRNTFTRNVAAECDEYGYFFQATAVEGFDLNLPVSQPDGTRRAVDVRTLPFVRFEDNEAHCQRRHGFNLGGGVPFTSPGVGGVGPDDRHPFVIRNFRVWNAHWAIHPFAPSVLVDGLDIRDSEYGLWRPRYRRHAYRGVHMDRVEVHEEFLPDGVRPREQDYPAPLSPVDDLPPATVITRATREAGGRWLVRGTTSDSGDVRSVRVNGLEARALRPGFAEWEVTLDSAPTKLSAYAEDAAGNVERRPHVVLAAPVGPGPGAGD